MTNAQLCPCGSQLSSTECCVPIIQGKKKAPTAEALMRARYTAFTRGDIDFILSSHHSKTRGEVKRDEIADWSKNSTWMGLEIVNTDKGTAQDNQGVVTFHAQYKLNDKVTDHWEHALFEKENGDWRFLDAQAAKTGPIRREEPKVGRNDPCPCGSGKKYKKCCAQ